MEVVGKKSDCRTWEQKKTAAQRASGLRKDNLNRDLFL